MYVVLGIFTVVVYVRGQQRGGRGKRWRNFRKVYGGAFTVS
jgi:hypothetical protein